MHSERRDFSDVNITSPGKGCTVHGTQRSKVTSMISMHLQSCVTKIIKSVHICKSYCEKISGTFLCGHSVNTFAFTFFIFYVPHGA